MCIRDRDSTLWCIHFFVQLGTLGAGNHYAEIQVVEEIYDGLAATRMGIEEKGQVSGCHIQE